MFGAILLIVLYFAPIIVAVVRKHKSIYAIAAVNVLLGWTGIGWFWALIWSLGFTHNNNQTIIINNSNTNNK